MNFLFNATLPNDISSISDHEGWVSFSVNAIGTYTTDTFTGEFLVPEGEADYGIISDIDDTILSTGVTSFIKWKVILNSLFVNSFRRIPLAGAPELYRKLHLGIDNKEKNPFFYLSNSPWNMYQYLKSFLDHNGFPKGPILLRSFSSIFQRALGAEKPHKQKEIVNLLQAYPQLKFILIGDSGEHDATIYTDIAAQFPDRILCIYLRSVNHRRRMQHVRSIVDNFRTTPVLLVETSDQAEAHARMHGYI
jgi:phosphatidate phosphatase APP1